MIVILPSPSTSCAACSFVLRVPTIARVSKTRDASGTLATDPVAGAGVGAGAGGSSTLAVSVTVARSGFGEAAPRGQSCCGLPRKRGDDRIGRSCRWGRNRLRVGRGSLCARRCSRRGIHRRGGIFTAGITGRWLLPSSRVDTRHRRSRWTRQPRRRSRPAPECDSGCRCRRRHWCGDDDGSRRDRSIVSVGPGRYRAAATLPSR